MIDDYVAGTSVVEHTSSREACGNWCSYPAKGSEYEQLQTGVDMCCEYNTWTDDEPYCLFYIGNLNYPQRESIGVGDFSSWIF